MMYVIPVGEEGRTRQRAPRSDDLWEETMA